jgi:hypothetical protein
MKRLYPPVKWLLFPEPQQIFHKKKYGAYEIQEEDSFQFAVKSACSSYVFNLLSDEQVE